MNNDDTTGSNHDEEEHPNTESPKTEKSKESSTIDVDVIKGICHAPLPKIRGNGVATRVGDVYTQEKYPTYTR